MGVSTNAQICFGISFDDNYEFPWGWADADIAAWWLDTVHQFKHSNGNYLNGNKRPTQKEVEKYYDEIENFLKAHPLPVEVVLHCSDNCPIAILAVPGTFRTASRGFPLSFTPQELVVSEDQIKSLLNFCKEHDILYDNEPSWILSSYWW